jgi:uncharacterized small protein (DUF1192 family)
MKLPPSNSDYIKYLVRARFPDARFKGQSLASSRLQSGPGYQSTQRAAEAYWDELANLSPEELSERVAAHRALEQKAARLKAEREEQQRPFNRPEAKANLDRWASMSYWTIDEAVALSFGREPTSAPWKHIQAIEAISPFARQFAAKREVAMGAKMMGQLWEKTTPSVFLAWAERMRFSMPHELVEAVKALGIQIGDWKTLFEDQKALAEKARSELEGERAEHIAAIRSHSEYISKIRDQQNELVDSYKGLLAKRDGIIAEREKRLDALVRRIAELDSGPPAKAEKPLGAKERESLLKLVIGMAVRGYGFDPKAARTSTAKEISSDLELNGVALDEDTVRKYLAEAKQLLPGDETEQKG